MNDQKIIEITATGFNEISDKKLIESTMYAKAYYFSYSRFVCNNKAYRIIGYSYIQNAFIIEKVE